jgi:hypothetical protein
MSIQSLTSTQLRQAADIKEKIAALDKQLSQILGSTTKPAAAPKKKGGMSAAGRAKVAAAQRARWAKIKAAKPVKPVKKARNKMSAAAKAKLSALAKARWAKIKASGKKSL